MEAKDYINRYKRMCESHEQCENCELCDYTCMFMDIDRAEPIVEQWIQRHPVQTNKDKFLEILTENFDEGIVDGFKAHLNTTDGKLVNCGDMPFEYCYSHSCDTCSNNADLKWIKPRRNNNRKTKEDSNERNN